MSGLAELLVAAAVSAAVMGAVLAAVGSAHVTLLTESDGQDASQRLRVAVEVLRRDLLAATLVLPFRDGVPTGDAITIREGTARREFYFDAAASKLRRVDGEGASLPVLDGITQLGFELLGDDGPIAAPTLQDGPWLPSAESADRFDADALNVRLVRVHVTADGRHAHDADVTFDVAPRSLNLSRSAPDAGPD